MSELIPKIEKMLVKYTFTEKERQEIASEMAQSVTEKQDLENDFKAIKDDFKARISRSEAMMQSAATKLNNGYEMRSIECAVEMDYQKKTVTFRRIDNQEVARVRPMTADELQGELEFN